MTYDMMITLQYITDDYTCTYQNLAGTLSAEAWIACPSNFSLLGLPLVSGPGKVTMFENDNCG